MFNDRREVFGGGAINKSVRVYNEEGHRIFRTPNGLAVQLTGEQRDLDTPKGRRNSKRLREITRPHLTYNKTEGNRSQSELWLPTEHIRHIRLTRNGNPINGTDHGDLKDAACWSWALHGDLVGVRDARSANSLYDSIVNMNLQNEPVTYSGHNDLATHLPNATQAQRDAVANASAPVVGLAGNVNNPDTRAFQKALMEAVVSHLGFNIIHYNENSQYQIHMNSNSFFGWDHWGISILMDNGNRNYVQTVTGVPVYTDCAGLWDEHLEVISISIQDLKAAHHNLLDDLCGFVL